jgi:hypothetical protein
MLCVRNKQGGTNVKQYVGIRDILGRPGVSAEQASANRVLGKGPRRQRPAESGLIRGGRTWFYGQIKRGVLPPPIKVGRKSLWRLDDIVGAIERFEAKR